MICKCNQNKQNLLPNFVYIIFGINNRKQISDFRSTFPHSIAFIICTKNREAHIFLMRLKVFSSCAPLFFLINLLYSTIKSIFLFISIIIMNKGYFEVFFLCSVTRTRDEIFMFGDIWDVFDYLLHQMTPKTDFDKNG